tara:strand:- start:983 stop:2131 length:1149 start_codon:yes stop_codon:yes gene_type:complete
MASRETGFRDYYKTKAASGYRPDRDRRQPKQPSFFDRVGQAFTGGAEKAKSYLPGTWGMATRGIDAVLRNRKMHGENVDYFGGNLLDSKVPTRVKESLMTPRDQSFYDKYMNLASLTDDTEKKQYYIDQANTARQNMQITGRLNYGLSQIDPQGTYTNREGLPSYSQDLFGEGYNRFNLDRFKEAMGLGEGILGGLDPDDRHPEALHEYEKETFGLPPYMREDEGIFGDIPVTDPPRGKELNPLIPDWSLDLNKDREMTTTDTDLAGDPRPWLRDEIEDPLLDIDEPDLGVDLKLPFTPPFDDSGREEGIMRNMMPQQRRDEDHPLWDQYWNFLIDEGDSYDNIQGGPPTFDQYLGAWERLHALPRGLHYGERHITPHWMKN